MPKGIVAHCIEETAEESASKRWKVQDTFIVLGKTAKVPRRREILLHIYTSLGRSRSILVSPPRSLLCVSPSLNGRLA